MKMIVPPECQGQIVEVSYGDAHNGTMYRRIVDRSDRSERWERAEYDDLFPECGKNEHADGCNCWNPWSTEPSGDSDAWEPCAEPSEED